MWCFIFILILLIIYPYCIYPIILMILPKKYPFLPQEIDYQIKSISLYIAAYNEENVIEKKIENSLQIDTCGIPFEIVVGSDGSTDATNDIVKRYEAKYQNIRLLNFTEREGKVNVINKGIPLCHGEIILLSDANAMYNSDCIKWILPHFGDSCVGCVAGEKRILKEDGMISNNEGMYWRLEAKIKSLESKVKTVIGADGACYVIRKTLFRSLPPNTSVDDFLLSMKIVEQGYRISYEPNAYSMEESGKSMQEELARKVRIAAGNYYNLRFLKKFFRLNLVSIMFYSHKVLRWVSPFIFLLLTVMLAFEALFSKFALYMILILGMTYLVSILKYWRVSNCLINNKFVNLISYFYLTVWAQFLGFFKYCMGRQKAIWNTIRS